MTEEIAVDGYFRPGKGVPIPSPLADEFKPGEMDNAVKLWKDAHPNDENLTSDDLQEECESAILEYYAQRHWI